MSRLLAGVRVLECGALLNCDTVGMRLADMGADVIKIEQPPVGDYLRDINGVIAPRWSPAHLHVNRGKRSIALDLTDLEDLDVFWQLLQTADVFVDGLTAGAADRLGIGYAEQRSRKPGIVYCQYTGFGADGPYATVPTHGQMMDALASGQPRVLDQDGMMVPLLDGGPNAKSGGEGTSAGAMHATTHILAGIIQRDRTGEGCYIDVAASDAVVAQAWGTVATALNADRIVDPENIPAQDHAVYRGAKYQFYETADDLIVLFCAIEHRFWDAFCDAIGRPDLRDRKNLATPVDFGSGDDELRLILQSVFRGRTQREWMDLAVAHRIPIGPAPRDFDEMSRDPHVRHRGILIEDDHPAVGRFVATGEGAVVAGQPLITAPAPAYDEHGQQIRHELAKQALAEHT